MTHSDADRTSRASRYRARWVLPISSLPIENGEVAVGEDGRIVRVGPAVTGETGAPLIDLGEAILLPGLVNVHAHPELTVLRGSLEGFPFHDWIERIIPLKYDVLQPEELAASTRWGVAEAARAGVTSIGAVDDAGYAPHVLAAFGLRGVCYVELFGPDPANADRAFADFTARFDELRSHLADGGGDARDRLRLGISPHSPYTVSAPLMERAIEFARSDGLPVSIHAAESAAETAFVTEGSGPFADRLSARGIAIAPTGRSSIEWLADRGALGPDVLLAHCVQVAASDIDLLAETGTGVAHCPVSNAKLGQGIAPLAALVERGVPIGIGSDSVATNNRVDIFSEARTGALLQTVVTGDPEWSEPERWIRMATLGGAEALGLGGEAGSLEPGKWADFAAVDLAAPHMIPAPDPYAALAFSACASDVGMTVVAGRPIYVRDTTAGSLAQSDRALLEGAARRLGS